MYVCFVFWAYVMLLYFVVPDVTSCVVQLSQSVVLWVCANRPYVVLCHLKSKSVNHDILFGDETGLSDDGNGSNCQSSAHGMSETVYQSQWKVAAVLLSVVGDKTYDLPENLFHLHTPRKTERCWDILSRNLLSSRSIVFTREAAGETVPQLIAVLRRLVEAANSDGAVSNECNFWSDLCKEGRAQASIRTVIVVGSQTILGPPNAGSKG